MSRRLVSSLGILICVFAATHARAESVADSLSQEVRTLFDRCHASVVKVEATDQNGQLYGTGFFIDPSGTLLTSYSVGGESKGIVIVDGDLKYPARRLIADARSGIAILKIEKSDAGTPFIPIGKSTDLTVATPVVSVAFPMDMPLTPNFGMVAGFDLKYLDRYFVITHIRANVPVQRGESGAPLLNMRGEAVGVVISGIDGGAACFALPIEAAEKIHRDFVRFGAARPGWLGLHLGDANNAAQGSTAEVEYVDENAPALKAGIQKGDIVLKIGQAAIKTRGDVQNACFYLTAGEPVPITIWRGDKEATIQVEPAERSGPDSGSDTRPHPAAPSGLDDITLRLP